MAVTTNVTLVTDDYTLIKAGPTTETVSISPDGDSIAIANAASKPASSFQGHPVTPGETANVTLQSGENLYGISRGGDDTVIAVDGV